jgi:hypothetical protein
MELLSGYFDLAGGTNNQRVENIAALIVVTLASTLKVYYAQ